MGCARWKRLEERYLLDPINEVDMTSLVSRRNKLLALRRNLTRPDMGEKGFAMALQFLGVLESTPIENGVELLWSNGIRTRHTAPQS